MDSTVDAANPDSTPRVVVGVDGSPGSRAALAWALEAAARSGAVVEAVAAFPVDFYWTDVYLADPRRIDAVTADTRALASDLVDSVRQEFAQDGVAAPAVELVVVPGHAAEHLVRRSRDADLLVVGSRGRGGVASTLLGSVALHCSAHARCRVVVVHQGTQAPEPRVVVGLDDSAMSRAAVRQGADQAAGLGAELEVVVAYQQMNYWSDLYAVMAPPVGETKDQAEGRARQILSDVLGEEAHRLTIRIVAEEGTPGDVLVRRAAGARLLVVGSQSHSRLEGMVLGSVALHCVVHARCPVMVVHPDRNARAATAAAAGAAAPVS